MVKGYAKKEYLSNKSRVLGLVKVEEIEEWEFVKVEVDYLRRIVAAIKNIDKSAVVKVGFRDSGSLLLVANDRMIEDGIAFAIAPIVEP